jgi:ammonia channel protein AmtB
MSVRNRKLPLSLLLLVPAVVGVGASVALGDPPAGSVAAKAEISSGDTGWVLVYDDALDAFGVHGIGGVWGALATGLFATTAVNPAGADGLFYGNPAQLWVQLKAVGATMAYSLIASLVLFKVVDVVARLRVSEHDERVGLDLTQHKEAAYTVID